MSHVHFANGLLKRSIIFQVLATLFISCILFCCCDYAWSQKTQSTVFSTLSTHAERSGWIETGRYEEVVRLCHAFEASYPNRVRCEQFGTTPESRPMLALVASDDATLNPKSAKAIKRPVIVLQGGIHAGEVDGKDAGFLFLRDLLDGKIVPGALRSLTVIFIPVLNVDGHERFGPNNRPNQNGPRESGWRTNALNLNLNRDYVKADAPETQAVLRYLNQWDPIAYADMHATDGAEFQHDIAALIQPTLVGPAKLQAEAVTFRDELMNMLTAQGHLPLPVYPEFVTQDDPASGIREEIQPPRYSHAYWAQRNRIGILIETHSWKDYRHRVRATYDCLTDVISIAQRRGAQWIMAAQEADRLAAEMAGKSIVLLYKVDEKSTPFEFKAYSYTRELSSISGTLWTSYDNTRPVTMRIPLYNNNLPSVQVTLPKAGYVIPAAYANLLAKKLDLHHIQFEVIGQITKLPVQVYRIKDYSLASAPQEGRTRLTTSGAWESDEHQFAAGSLFVPIDQPLSQLAAQLLEPTAPDSMLSWGYFNAILERPEYMEAYVAEAQARNMLVVDSRLKAEFENLIVRDSEFARDPSKRLDFFYQRHPAFDREWHLYPVFRLEQPWLGRKSGT